MKTVIAFVLLFRLIIGGVGTLSYLGYQQREAITDLQIRLFTLQDQTVALQTQVAGLQTEINDTNDAAVSQAKESAKQKRAIGSLQSQESVIEGALVKIVNILDELAAPETRHNSLPRS